MFDRKVFEIWFVFFLFFSVLLTQVCSAGKLQDMINATGAGETVFIDDGVYRESLILDKDLKLVGKSRSSVILYPNPLTKEDAISIRRNCNITIEGITVEVSKPGDTAPTVNGIMGYGSTVQLIDCQIKGAGYNGIYLIDCDSIITNCDFQSNDKSGIQAKFGNVKVSDCTITKNKEAAINLYTDGHTDGIKRTYLKYEISNCDVNGNKQGFYFKGNCSGKIISNHIIDNEIASIFIDGCAGKNDIFANVISQSQYGIFFKISSNEDKEESMIEKNICSNLKTAISIKGENTIVNVSANQCKNNDGNGIEISNGPCGNLMNNVCEDNGGQGIYLLRTAKGTLLENNVCHRNKYNGIYIGAGYVTARNNDCKENSYNGISADCGVVTIEQNKCAINKGSGIYLERFIDGSVKGNTSINNRFYGIVRGSYTVIPEIKDNEMSGNLKGRMWEKKTPYGELWYLLKGKQFAKLDSIASGLRNDQSKDPNGRFLIRFFYNELGMGWENVSPEHQGQVIGLLNEWIKERPESITPYVILSDLYIYVGWGYRGTGWAYEVTEDGWKKFNEFLGKAVEVVRKAEKLEEKDPHLYCRLIKVGMATSNPRLEKEGFKKGITINKYYPSLYFEKANGLLPRWGGMPGELEAFAYEAFKQTEDKYSAILYARLALYTHSNSYPKFDQFNFSYDLIKQGHEDILKGYPDSKHYMNSYCLFACLNNDQEKAKELFKKIGMDYSYVIWKDKANYKKHYDWVFGVNMP